MELANDHPFDTFLAEVRRRFFELPRVHERPNTLSNVAYGVIAELPNERVPELLVDAYLHKDRWEIKIPSEEFSGDTLQEVVQDVIIGAAVHLLQQDEEVNKEETIRRGFQDRLEAGYQEHGIPEFLYRDSYHRGRQMV